MSVTEFKKPNRVKFETDELYNAIYLAVCHMDTIFLELQNLRAREELEQIEECHANNLRRMLFNSAEDATAVAFEVFSKWHDAGVTKSGTWEDYEKAYRRMIEFAKSGRILSEEGAAALKAETSGKDK